MKGLIAVSGACIVVLTGIAVIVIFIVYSKLLNETLTLTKKKIDDIKDNPYDEIHDDK
jgi:hypothetical protein